MYALKLVDIGDSVGMALSEEMLARWRLSEGDTVLLTELPNGCVALTPHALSLEEQLAMSLPSE